MTRLFTLAAALLLAGCGLGNRAATTDARQQRFGRVDAALDGNRWLAEDADRARKVGAGPLEILAAEAGAPGDRVAGLVDVPTNACVLLFARAAPSVEDLDLFAYGDDGSVLGSDESPDRTPSVMVCPPHPSRLYVAARVASGHGLVAVGAQAVPVKLAASVGQRLKARGRPGESLSTSHWPMLEQKLAEHRRQLGGHWQDLRRAAVPVDPRTPARVGATVEAGQCVDVLILPSDEVSHLDVALEDADGRITGRAAALGRERSLLVCSEQRSDFTLQIRPHVGRGVAGVVMSRSSKQDLAELSSDVRTIDLSPVAELGEVRAKLHQRLERAGYGKPKLVTEGTLSIGQRSSIELELAPGCTRFDLVGGKPLHGIEGWLWDDQGQLLAKRSGPALTTLFACSPGGSARLDAEAVLRPGRFALEQRIERETPKLLEAHPLAAGRLLALMLERGVILSGRQVGAPRALALTTTALQRVDFSVPIGRCVDVVAALGPGGSGLEVVLVDTANGRELGRSRAPYQAGARACALDRGALQGRAELRVHAGSATALVATRMLQPKP